MTLDFLFRHTRFPHSMKYDMAVVGFKKYLLFLRLARGEGPVARGWL